MVFICLHVDGCPVIIGLKWLWFYWVSYERL